MQLVFASNNLNKIKEIQQLLPGNISLLSLKDIGCFEDIPETAETIEGNALLKARYIKDKYGYDCFADDTGLEIDALQGAPGVYSARYAGNHKNTEDNIIKVLQELSNKNNRKAQFKTVIALIIKNQEYCFEGIINGKITTVKKGNNGFGYDPIFIPDNQDHTFAELSMEEKSKISHRGIAVQKLMDQLKQL